MIAATFALTCYRDRYATGLTLDDAKAEKHILECPQGAMPWADPIVWHQTTWGSWVSAAGGQWLDHHLQPEPFTYTEWRVTGEPGGGFPTYAQTWSGRYSADAEAEARAFVAQIRQPDHSVWDDGPHLTSRQVTVKPWKFEQS